VEGKIDAYVIKVVAIAIGVLIPVILVLFNRVIKNYDKDNTERDAKIRKLFAISDDNKKCMTDKAVQIGRVEKAVEMIDADIKEIREELRSK